MAGYLPLSGEPAHGFRGTILRILLKDLKTEKKYPGAAMERLPVVKCLSGLTIHANSDRASSRAPRVRAIRSVRGPANAIHLDE